MFGAITRLIEDQNPEDGSFAASYMPHEEAEMLIQLDSQKRCSTGYAVLPL